MKEKIEPQHYYLFSEQPYLEKKNNMFLLLINKIKNKKQYEISSRKKGVSSKTNNNK